MTELYKVKEKWVLIFRVNLSNLSDISKSESKLGQGEGVCGRQ